MGFSVFKQPEYLYRTDKSLFIFRMKAPDCQPSRGGKEVQCSLKTYCVYSTRKHIALTLPLLQTFFEGIRHGIYADLQQADLNQAIRAGIHREIANVSIFRKASSGTHRIDHLTLMPERYFCVTVIV